MCVRGLSRDAEDGWEPICARETECACKVNKTTDNPDYTATTTILRYMCILVNIEHLRILNVIVTVKKDSEEYCLKVFGV